jgi:hypothetical protein
VSQNPFEKLWFLQDAIKQKRGSKMDPQGVELMDVKYMLLHHLKNNIQQEDGLFVFLLEP